MTPEIQSALELIDRVRALSYRTDAELFSLCGPSFKVADAYRQSEAELDKAREEIEALKRDNDRLNKEWGEIKYAYDHAKENGRWHEERNGDAQSELYECESRAEQAESSLKRTEEALGGAVEALEEIDVELKNGFVRCAVCGGQEDLETLDCRKYTIAPALARIKALTQDNHPPSAEKKT